jgi:hypothetical protein
MVQSDDTGQLVTVETQQLISARLEFETPGLHLLAALAALAALTALTALTALAALAALAALFSMPDKSCRV